MQADSATRILLALILLCLVILIVQGFGSGGREFEPGWGRYSVTGMRAGAPVLIRTDSVTGQVWKLELRGGRNTWVAFQEPPESAADSAREPESEGAAPAAATEVDVVEPPGAPPLPDQPRRASAEILAALPPPPGVSPDMPLRPGDMDSFVDALANEQLPVDMRAWAAGQLAGFDEQRSTMALIAASGSGEPMIATAALRALEGRGGASVRAAGELAKDHPDATVRSAGEKLLGSLE